MGWAAIILWAVGLALAGLLVLRGSGSGGGAGSGVTPYFRPLRFGSGKQVDDLAAMIMGRLKIGQEVHSVKKCKAVDLASSPRVND